CAPMPGRLTNGSGCGDHGQCQSAFCKKAAGELCGVCAVRGLDCRDVDDCKSGRLCANGACVQPATAGAHCSSDQPCGGELRCNDSVCQRPASTGTSCTPGADDCDLAGGDYCNPFTAVCE